MEYKRLSEEEISEWLKRVKGWSISNGKLYKEFIFKDFIDAFGFMTKVALEAERINHHPEWFNVYNRVRIELVTHDISAISNYDIRLAEKIDKRYETR